MSQITKQYTFTQQTKILSAQVNQNFDDLFTQINSHDGNITALQADNTTHTNQIGILSGKVIDLANYSRIGGETDDYGLLGRAIADAKSQGKLISIPPNKTYTFGQTLQMYNNIGFVGGHMKTSVLNYTGTGNAFNLIDTSNTHDPTWDYGCYYNTFKNLTIQGNGTSNGSVAISGELRYSYFEDVIISNFQTIINVNDNWNNYYQNCIFQNANIFYKAGSQNNNVTFLNCYIGNVAIMLEMQSCYSFAFVGGNIESVSSVLFLPTNGGGCTWANLTIDDSYIEGTVPMIDTTINAGDTTAITSWILRNFQLSNSTINFNNSSKAFIYTRINDVIVGSIENNGFYKNDNSTLFDMQSSATFFKQNKHQWWNGSALNTLTTPFSSYMTTWNTQYQQMDIAYPNVVTYSGALSPSKGMVLGSTSDNNLIATIGHMLYDSTRQSVRLATSGSTANFLQPIRSGATASRPTGLVSSDAGYIFYDTTLGKPIVWNGSAWKDVNNVGPNNVGVTVSVAQSATSLTVTFPVAEPDANYAVSVTPGWNTTFWYPSKSATGFTINFGTAVPTGGAYLDWSIKR